MEKINNENSDTNECYVSLENLEIYQIKKNIHFTIYDIQKEVKVSSYKVLNKEGAPYVCYIYFESKEDKEKFINLYYKKDKTYYKSLKKLEININPPKESELEINSDIPIESHVTFKTQYEKLCYESFERSFQDEGLVYIDDDVLQKQRAIIGSVIKQIGEKIMTGESVMNIALPVNIFDERTLLQT